MYKRSSGLLSQLKGKSGKPWLETFLFFTIFGLTGISTATAAALLRPFFGMDQDTPLFITILYFVFLTLPIHQILLLFWGFVFGRFRTYLAYEITMFRRIGRIFRKKQSYGSDPG